MKKPSALWLLLTLFVCACSDQSHSQNIALNKTYTVSPVPNYNLTSPDPTHTQLTDGVYTSDHFWTSKTTVGWISKSVNIEIDLGNPAAVSKVSFNTVRGNAGVEFPSNIYVFTSTDKQAYAYVGDAAIDPDNVHGAYEIKKFTISGINRTARYIKFIVMPNGPFVFCDEIEVIAGKNGSNDNPQNLITNVNAAVDSLGRNKNKVKKAAFQIQRLKASMNGPGNGGDVAALVNDRDLNSKLVSARGERAKYLKNKFRTDAVIDKVNPWEPITSPYQPKGNKDNSFNISTSVKGVQYGAFVITNLSSASQVFNCQFDGTSAVSSTELFTVPFVTSGSNYTEVADPLLKVDQGVRIGGGESRMFLFKVMGQRKGQGSSVIKINSGSFSSQLTVNTNVVDQIPANGNFSINGICWAYLTYPLINDRQDEVIKDLLAHHINTMVIPSGKIPMIGGNNDFSAYNSYLSKLKPFRNIFLFMDLTSKAYKDSFQQDPFMSDSWKDKFNTWYGQLAQNTQSVGFSPSQLYLYLFDEVSGPNIDKYADFINWLKTAHPDIHTFTTITNKQAVETLLRLLTVGQLLDIDAVVKEAPNYGGKSQWLYNTVGNSEALSPYAYYRLMGWKAFCYGYSGVGFWNYADYENGTNGKTDLDNFDGVSATNYSAVYDGPGKSIISSRRWEAYSLGMEDYEILKKYAQKNGVENAKILAKSVIDNPNDLQKADAVRDQMLKSL